MGLVGAPILDKMQLLVEEYNAGSKTLTCLLIMADFNLSGSSSPFGFTVELAQRGYEVASAAVIEAYFECLKVDQGSVLYDLTGVQVEITEEYLMWTIEPDTYVASNRFVSAGFVEASDLFPWKYRKIRIRYRATSEYPSSVALPEGYRSERLPPFFPEGRCFGWYSPELTSSTTLVLLDKWISDDGGYHVYLVPPEWLLSWAAYESASEEYMHGESLDCFTPWLSGDPDYDVTKKYWISRRPGMTLKETYEYLSDEGMPLYGVNGEQRPQWWLRAGSIEHSFYSIGYNYYTVAYCWAPLTVPVYGVFQAGPESDGGGVPISPGLVPKLKGLLKSIKGFEGTRVSAKDGYSSIWSEWLDGSWYLNGVHSLLE